ncbi:hypothetical protein DSS3PM1_00090 [Bacteriophage DSS3_PM1]|nr:hypothetical protein DSS3PM1_00090 [Bacteriophage DSS3_PM1]
MQQNKMTFEEIMSQIEVGKRYKILTEDWETDPHTTLIAECVEKWEDAVGFMIIDREDIPNYYAEIYEGELEEVYRGPAPEFL